MKLAKIKKLVRHLGFNRKLNYVETKKKNTWFLFLHNVWFIYDENRVDSEDFLQKIPRYFLACMLKMKLMTKSAILNQTGSRIFFRMSPYLKSLVSMFFFFFFFFFFDLYQVTCLYHK